MHLFSHMPTRCHMFSYTLIHSHVYSYVHTHTHMYTNIHIHHTHSCTCKHPFTHTHTPNTNKTWHVQSSASQCPAACVWNRHHHSQRPGPSAKLHLTLTKSPRVHQSSILYFYFADSGIEAGRGSGLVPSALGTPCGPSSGLLSDRLIIQHLELQTRVLPKSLTKKLGQSHTASKWWLKHHPRPSTATGPVWRTVGGQWRGWDAQMGQLPPRSPGCPASPQLFALPFRFPSFPSSSQNLSLLT